MKIAVIGANGKSGRAFVERALLAGHIIHAGVRDPSKHSLHPDPFLTVFKCDATDIEQVRVLISGCDAVVSLIGHVKGSHATMQTDAIKAILSAMKTESIARVVSLTGTGVRFDHDAISVIDRFLNIGIATIDPNRINDGINHAEILKTSGTDWTILRVLKLQDTVEKPFSLSLHGPAKLITSRHEVAKAIVQILASDGYINTAPIISK